MSYVRSLLTRLFGRGQSRADVKQTSRLPAIEGLESRQMMAASPLLTAVHFTGSLRAVTSVQFTFDESLDPASAENMQSYAVGRLLPAPTSSDGINLVDILGFLAQPKRPAVRNGRVQFSSATYDDSTFTVTLTPVASWSALRTFRFIRVMGVGVNALKDASGNPLNGGLNTYVHWFAHMGKSFVYTDADGDLVRISIHGRGQLVSFLQTNADHAPTIFILNGQSTSVLTGSVKQARTGDGVAVIPEIQGVSTVNAAILSNPQFNVLSTEP
jgi:hypothetical protein